jgi:4-amino-4-deoxy-L-arabinose transferase-like glycosyltransferase
MDFRLRVIGDASPTLRACSAVFAETYPLKLGFQIPYCTTLAVTDIRTWLLIQILFWCLTVVLIYRTGANLFDERTGLLAGVAMALTWETFRFALRPQSDAMLVFGVALAFWALSRDEIKSSRRTTVLVVVTLLFTMFTKQLGFPIVFLWVLWLLIPVGTDPSFDFRNPSSVHLVLALTVGIVSIFVLSTYFLGRFTGPAPEPGIYWRRGFAGAWWNGIVSTHPSTPTFEYIYQPRMAASMATWMVSNADHIFLMTLHKFAFLFVPVLPRWDTLHILVNTVTIFPLVVGTLLGASRLLSERRYHIAGLIFAPIVAVLIVVGLNYVDGGFNYRAPATPSFVLLTAYWTRHVAIKSGTEGRVVEMFFSRIMSRDVDSGNEG